MTGNQEDEVEGIAFKMTHEEIAKLDPFEGFPNFYNRQAVAMLAYKDARWQPLDGEAYVQVLPETFDEPSLLYKIACCKTVFMHRKLINSEASSTVELEITNACNG
mmetsp:Transcript_6424/g.8603  ORF Transcript_6424/g.8603 Transcript_6424/m.8603 type:complete len:106 (+) Transcript_6424:213-530(+)